METVLKYLPVIVFYIKCFVSYFTFARTNAKSNEYLTRLRHPKFRTYWGHKILLAAWDFTTKGTFYIIALFIWIFPGSQDLFLNILIVILGSYIVIAVDFVSFHGDPSNHAVLLHIVRKEGQKNGIMKRWTATQTAQYISILIIVSLFVSYGFQTKNLSICLNTIRNIDW